MAIYPIKPIKIRFEHGLLHLKEYKKSNKIVKNENFKKKNNKNGSISKNTNFCTAHPLIKKS